MNYREFRIQVLNDHDVTIVRPSGVSYACKVPMDPLRLRTIEIFQEWLARGEIRSRDEVVVLGTHLYEGLFDQSARREFEAALAKTETDEDTALRVVLGFGTEAAELAQLPWEYLYFPDTDTGGSGFFIAAAIQERRLTLAREVPLVIEDAPSDPPPLKVLLVVSEPTAGGLGAVKAEEVIGTIGVLEGDAPGSLRVERLDQPTKRSLAEIVRAFRPHVVHFFGHGQWDEARRRGALALVRADGKSPLWVTDADLADSMQPVPRLIFLHACEGARSESYAAFRGVALQLVRSRVPAVVAMQFQIENKVARAFAIKFYESLGAGNPVDAAVRDGRREIGMFLGEDEENFSRRSFGSPVVYLQQGHGIVIAEAAAEAGPAAVELALKAPCPYQRCSGTVLSRNRFCPACRRPIDRCPNPDCTNTLYPVEEGFCGDCGYDEKKARAVPARAASQSRSALGDSRMTG